MEKQRRHNSSLDRPNMCDVRFVLLGKNETEISRVRNVILHGNEEAETLEQNNVMRVSGRVKKRHVTVIYPLHLLNLNTSDDQITQTVRECVSLSEPGPHVFIIALQYRDFTEEDMRRVKYVLNKFSEEVMRRTIIITTDEETNTSPEIKLSAVHQLMEECGGGRLELEEENGGMQSEIFKRVNKILKRNQEEYLKCEINEEVKETSVDEQSRSEEEKKSLPHKDDEKHKSQSLQREKNSFFTLKRKSHQKLNLVLCGNDGSLIVAVSKLLRGKKIKLSHERAVRSVCVKKEEKIDGRLLSLVELPALRRLSEEEVMRQTLCSVTLCDPGVHAFIIIVPVRPLNNDEQSGVEKILKIFNSREHFMLLFTTDKTRNDTRVADSIKHSPESQSLISRCGGRYCVIGLKKPENSRQTPDLLDYIEDMKTEPYSPQMFVKVRENIVRHEIEEKYEELNKMESKIRQSEAAERTKESEEEIKKIYEEKVKEMKKKHEDEARKLEEEYLESTERKLKHVLELTEMVKEKDEPQRHQINKKEETKEEKEGLLLSEPTKE